MATGIKVSGGSGRHVGIGSLSRICLLLALLSPGLQSAAPIDSQIYSAPTLIEQSTTSDPPVPLEPPIGAIEIKLLPGFPYNPDIRGRVHPGSYVYIQIWRDGKLAANTFTGSDQNGDYQTQLYTEPNLDPIRPGDEVRVFDGQSTYSMTIAPIQAWADPRANLISGSTLPGMKIDLILVDNLQNPCQWTTIQKSFTLNSDGSFQFNPGDFSANASILIHARYPNGNSSWVFIHAYQLFIDRAKPGQVRGYYRPTTTLDVHLIREGALLESVSLQTNLRGEFNPTFSQTPIEGDWIEAYQAGQPILGYYLARLEVSYDPDLNRIQGQTVPGRKVWIIVNDPSARTDSSHTPVGCSPTLGCANIIAGPDGQIQLTPPAWVAPESSIVATLYDTYGNYQIQTVLVSLPSIQANLSDRNFSVQWNRSVQNATARLFDIEDNKIAETTLWLESGARTYFSLGELKPGYRIEVTDGTTTRTLTLPNAFPRLHHGSNQISGPAPNGRATLDFVNGMQRPESFTDQCLETSIVNQQYQFTIPGVTFQQFDKAYLVLVDDVGNEIVSRLYPFSLNLNMDPFSPNQNFVAIGTEYPDTRVDVIHERGGQIIGSYLGLQAQSSLTGVGLSTTTFKAGDIVHILTNDGNSVDLTIPDLSVWLNTAQNRIEGHGPPNTILVAEFLQDRHYPADSGYPYLVQTDNQGSFSVDVDNLFWASCYPLSSSDPCAHAAVTYTDSNGFAITAQGPRPAPIAADGYEPDDALQSAWPYSGTIEQHTFHTSTDQDWISIPIGQQDVGRPFLFQVDNFERGMNVTARLFSSEGTQLFDNTDLWSKEIHSFSYEFSVPGTYYLQLIPGSLYSAGLCDSRYSIMINPYRMYFPVISR
ncbi:MAG TPA: hypothetical protein VMT46_05695 [Anaerolineaceae bacterium]|nr:hypothetical protein [Anaerolineaceae bacterium]